LFYGKKYKGFFLGGFMTEGQIQFNREKIKSFRGKDLKEITEEKAKEGGLKEVTNAVGDNIIHCAYLLGKKYKGLEEITFYSCGSAENEKGKKLKKITLYSGKLRT
jgi:hypothetical protein